MKNIKIIGTAIYVIVIMTITGCQKEPLASFTISNYSPSVNEIISFTNITTDGSSYEWNFGDGQTSTSKNPTHSYINEGVYTITLTAFSKNGKKQDLMTDFVTVSKIDPCSGITCINGTCANGICNCASGYTGSDCSQQITPTSIKISKIRVIRQPATDNGAGWDISDGADIYPLLLQNTTTIWNSPTFISNVNPNSTYDFTPSPAIDITSPNLQYTIELYDYDASSADDWMGGIIFTLYSSSNGFPTIVSVDAGGSVAFELTLSYVW